MLDRVNALLAVGATHDGLANCASRNLPLQVRARRQERRHPAHTLFRGHGEGRMFQRPGRSPKFLYMNGPLCASFQA